MNLEPVCASLCEESRVSMAAKTAVIAPTSGTVASYRGKSVALDVHFAVWDNNLPLLRDLLVSQCYGERLRFPHNGDCVAGLLLCFVNRSGDTGQQWLHTILTGTVTGPHYRSYHAAGWRSVCKSQAAC